MEKKIFFKRREKNHMFLYFIAHLKYKSGIKHELKLFEEFFGVL